METLSNTKIENIMSLTGNNKCFECESSDVDWVSFPSTVFLCLNCCRRHKEFKMKPLLKSLSVSEFSQHEIKKMNLGGNARFLTLLNEFKISLKEPNIEHKYKTVIALYYYKLLDVQVSKIENVVGAKEEYKRLITQKPSLEVGNQLAENVYENGTYQTDSKLGGWFGYFGDKINNVTEFIGLNGLINNASNSMERFGIKDKLNMAVDYSKSAGEYVIDKATEVSQSPIVTDAKEKISHAVNEVKDTAMNMINNSNSNNNTSENNNSQP